MKHLQFKIITVIIIAFLFISFGKCEQQQHEVQTNQLKNSGQKNNIENKKQQLGQENKNIQASASQSIKAAESIYTEDIQQFKSKKYNQRLQTVVGCWLLSKQYLQTYKSNYLFFKDQNLKQLVTLKLVKQCMKRISRKDAVVKIAALVGRNMQTPKKYQQVVLNKQIIDNIFIQVNKINLIDVNSIGGDQFVNGSNGEKVQVSFNENEASAIKDDAQKVNDNSQQKNDIGMSQFDIFLLDLIKKYDSQFSQLNSSKQGIKGKVQEQLKKRQKYYFGFIPASTFTHSVFLVTISLFMVCCCTCRKYYNMRTKQKQGGAKKMNQQEGHVHSASCSHSKVNLKQIRKVASKMTQITMKKKVK